MSTNSEPEPYAFGYCMDGTVCKNRERSGFKVRARWLWGGMARCTRCLKAAQQRAEDAA